MMNVVIHLYKSGKARLATGSLTALILCILAIVFMPPLAAYDYSLYVIYAILAVSLVFVWGWGGIFSFGQTAFFGLGAYCYGIVAINMGGNELSGLFGLAAAAALGAIVALVLGYFMFYGGIGDVYIAIITLAVTLVLLTVVSNMANSDYRVGDAVIGGFNGMPGIPALTLPGLGALRTEQFFALVLIIALALGIGLTVLRRSPFGRAVAAIKDNEVRANLLGYDLRRYRLAVFGIGGLIAGLAGALYASWSMFISPAVFSLAQAATLVIWVLVGGKDSILGAFVGVLIVQQISSALGEGGGSYTPIVLGLILILVVLLFRAGIVPAIYKWGRRLAERVVRRRTGAEVSLAVEAVPQRVDQTDPLPADTAERHDLRKLATTDISMRFGGVHAVRGVSLDYPLTGIVSLIGPNGAGKSTYFSILSGRQRPTSGEVSFGGRDMTRQRVEQRAKDGMGIKLQIPSVFPSLTVWENAWIAAYGRTRSTAKADALAMRTLKRMDLWDIVNTPASELSHGQVQWLEITMVVAGDPNVILLDEPIAGMSKVDVERTVRLIKDLAQHALVIVVEHDMDFVKSLDAPVVMFNEGSVFRKGTISEMQSDEEVLDVYLGRGVKS